jgi:hypothetical protein
MIVGGSEALNRDREKLRIAMDSEKKSRKGCSKVKTDMVNTSDYSIVGELLNQIKLYASTTGDATQRLAQCFSKGYRKAALEVTHSRASFTHEVPRGLQPLHVSLVL